MGAKYVICKANSALSAKVLEKVGADEVIRPEHDMGVRLGEQIATPSIVDAFKLGENHSVIEIEAQKRLWDFGRSKFKQPFWSTSHCC